MASQLFCLALLAVSAFGYDQYGQQYYPSQSYGLYNQQPAGSMQGELPYMNYIRQKQNYYLPYLAQKMHFIPAHAQQWIPQQGVPTGFEGQVNTPVNQFFQNREQGTEVPQVNEKVVVSHEKHTKVHSKKDKHSVVHVPINQEQQQQQQQESVFNYRDNTVHSQIRDVPVHENSVHSQIRDVPVQDNIFATNQRVNLPVQENTLPHQVRDVNQRQNILGNNEQSVPVQDVLRPVAGVNEVRNVNQRFNILENFEDLIRSYPEIFDVCQRINMPVHAVNALRNVNQILNIFGNTEGLIRSYPEIIDVCQRINMLVQGDVNQRVNLPVQGLVRPSFEVSELSQTVPLVQTNIDGTPRYNVAAPRYQSLHQYQPVSQVYPAQQYQPVSQVYPAQQYQPVSQVYPAQQYQPLSHVYPAQQYQPLSQVYPARQNFFSLLGLRPTQQVWEQNLPSYFANNDDFARNNLNVERNLVY